MTEWIPHTDFHDQDRWPPLAHPLYSMFHNARLGIHPWNYLEALEYGELKMRAGERVMRERQILINQITIMASIKELAQKQFGNGSASPIVMRCDAAIQVTSRLLRGMPIDQEETNVSKTV